MQGVSVHGFRVVLFSLALSIGGLAQAAQPAVHASGSKVTLDFVASPYADFLFYLLHRDITAFPQLKSAAPLQDVAPLTSGALLPGYVFASNAKSYNDLYRVAYSYENSAALVRALKQGQSHYAAFETFWRNQISPKEQATIDAWRAQQAQGDVMERLEKLARMPFPYGSLRVAVIGLGPLGHSIQNPPTLFATLDGASLPSVVGYEGTRMMLDAKGGNWRQGANAARAIRLVTAHGGSDYDLEEAVCLLMQTKLTQAYGARPSRDDSALANTPRLELLRAMERDWAQYEGASSLNVADFAVGEAIKTFGGEPVAELNGVRPK
ncbi:hypothetical protein DVT68_12505 [Dyella solisilvae]|uniref:Uncharacterized protein n=1 Tax=Dyella solisilvae TaxID=1920168 RepID=A0A370K5I6_9GAMM|nr:hypothetical protein [Dyella solisilvae]RDI97915.1 hypothetical protein DVT68_12505 [Dyella solisilvae]